MNESKRPDTSAGAPAIEIELSAEQLKGLLRSPAATPAQAGTQRRRSLMSLAGTGAALLLVIGAAYGYILTEPFSVRSVPVEPQPTIEAFEPTVEAIVDPVRVRNPFDEGEVFEFPAGTDVQVAQDAVADILLQRASERRASGELKRTRRS